MADLLAKVERLSTRHRTLESERNDAIREARAAGASLRAIAAVAGLSPQAIDNICKR